METNGGQRIGHFTIGCRAGSHTKAQRYVVHRVHHDALMLWRIFRYPTQTRLGNVIAIQKRLFTRWFQPDFVLSIRSQIVQSGDVEFEFVRFAKFAHACAQRNQLIRSHIFGQLQNAFGHIVDTIAFLSETIGAIGSINQMLHIGTNTEEKFALGNFPSLQLFSILTI